MTITLELPPEIEARLRAEAQTRGVSIGDVVKAYLIQQAQTARPTQQMSAEELDQAFEDIADIIPEGISPLSDEALSRESIYTRAFYRGLMR